ncbi:MAG: hypothetical protein JRG93_11100 [Deltaproteobacteria bacterium]|nr:hypothetical protein [Deltaproteobacteria bacterium]
MSTVFTNGRVSLTRCPVFGVSVMTEDGWVPISELSEGDLEIVRDALDRNPTCPKDISRDVYARSS